MAGAAATEVVHRDGDHATLAVAGDLDLATAPALRARVATMMGDGVRHLEVDLRDMSFVDSSGMGALLWSAHRLQAAGGDLHCVHPQPSVARAVELAGLSGVLAVTA